MKNTSAALEEKDINFNLGTTVTTRGPVDWCRPESLINNSTTSTHGRFKESDTSTSTSTSSSTTQSLKNPLKALGFLKPFSMITFLKRLKDRSLNLWGYDVVSLMKLNLSVSLE